jgi:hypothetical protein
MQLDPRLNQAIIEVVDTQVETNDPPETALTLIRLVNAGHTPVEAKNLIGCVVMSEVFDVLKSGEKFNLARYVAALHNLPVIPQGKI